jgi:hypothetical protein
MRRNIPSETTPDKQSLDDGGDSVMIRVLRFKASKANSGGRMRLRFCLSHSRRLGLFTLISASVIGQVAIADPLAPSKVRTIPIRSESADQGAGSAPRTELSKVHNLTVHPRFPGENRDASGRELSAAPAAGDGTLGHDVKAVHTVPVKSDFPLGGADPDHHFVQTTRIPAQSMPQNEIGTK